MKTDAAKIDIYMREVDCTLLRENLKLTFEQRAQKYLRALQMVEELRPADKKRAMSVDLAQVIPPLVRAKVDFILIGGMAVPVQTGINGWSSTDEFRILKREWESFESETGLNIYRMNSRSIFL